MRMNEIIGDWLQNFRTEHDLTLDQIANASHIYGTNWKSINIIRIEQGGGKADSLPTLMILLATLNDLTGNKIAIADIFTDYAGAVNVNTNCVTSYETVAHALEGDFVSFQNTREDIEERLQNSGNRSVPLGRNVFLSETMLPEFVATCEGGIEKIVSNHYPTAAEGRLEHRFRADKNDVFSFIFRGNGADEAYRLYAPEGLAVAAICDVLYGHSLDEEAVKRAGDGATPQKRGRVTRVLTDEIIDYMRNVIEQAIELEWGKYDV